MKKTFTFISMIAVLSLASCEKEQTFTVNTRTPHAVEFQTRTLNVTPGYALPSNVEAVDLGLSVKWANMNLGSTSASPAGDLYAWGEITPSGNYGWSSYEHNDFHANDDATLYLTKYCFDKYGESQDIKTGGVNLDKNDDAAYVQWGSDWRMPTSDELQELATKCTWKYNTTKKTFTVTGPNKNSIEISYNGVGIADQVWGTPQGSVYGGLWSSTLAELSSPFACMLYLNGQSGDKFEMGMNTGGANRCFGRYIRPVSTK